MRLIKTMAAALVCAGLATSATAQGVGGGGVNVRIERGGFYPPVIYVMPGTMINFTNHINKPANLHSVNYYWWRPDWREDDIGYLETRSVMYDPSEERTLRAPCFNDNSPPWWSDSSDMEWEIPTSEDNNMCNGWVYKRTHHQLVIIEGVAPNG